MLIMPGRKGDRRRVGKLLNSNCREKLLSRGRVPVPQTDTGRRGEDPKTNGRTLVKELGKLTPQLREKGCLLTRLIRGRVRGRREKAQATV